MRTTLNIDADVLGAIKRIAVARHISVAKVVSELVRSALLEVQKENKSVPATDFFGFDPLPRRGGVVSNELINVLRGNSIY
jgi:hypothetical protein